MLDIALNHEEELKIQLRRTWFDDRYKFYQNNAYCSDGKLAEDTWNCHQLVSIDKSGNLVGFIQYDIDRATLNCSGLGIISFYDDNLTFGSDVKQAITDIFEKFHFHKLSFCVVIGNPVERQYDRMIEKYGGRIIGIQKDHTKLPDNKYYDIKLYEILLESYLSSRYPHRLNL